VTQAVCAQFVVLYRQLRLFESALVAMRARLLAEVRPN